MSTRLSTGRVRSAYAFIKAHREQYSVDAMCRGEIAMVINTPEGAAASHDSFSIRRTALERQVPYFTTIAGAAAAAEGIEMLQKGALAVKALQDYHRES